MRTKEIQNTMIYTNETLWGEANPRTSGTKEAYQFNDDRKSDAFQPLFNSEGGDAGRLTPFLPNFPVGNEYGSRNSQGAEYHSELSRKMSIGSNTNSSVCFLNEGKNLDSTNKCRDSSKANASFQMDVASYGNKSVLERDTFDSEDHQKGMTEHVLKDISVDEVDYPVDKFSLRSSKNKSSTVIASSSNIFRHGSTEVGSDVEPSVSYQSAGLSFDGSTASEDDESLDGQVNARESSNSQLQKSFAQDPPKFSVNSVQKHESNSETASKNVFDVPQVAGTQRIFRSFLTSFGDEETKVPTGKSELWSSKPAVTVTKFPEEEQGNSSSEQFPSKDRKTPEQANHEKDNTLDVTVASQGKYDFGETSFSKASVMTYNEPIPQPGNISMRSDGSISGRSFAFPILQSEWNSSPVKMAKADRRHYRKHRGWRAGIFCCRF